MKSENVGRSAWSSHDSQYALFKQMAEDAFIDARPSFDQRTNTGIPGCLIE